MILLRHPNNPPRAPLKIFELTTTITGNICFYKQTVSYLDVTPWIDKKTRDAIQPMSDYGLMMLRSKIIGKLY